ncbi:class I SAM-dependent methyltransferase [Methanosarcina sp. Mfa9]|uniref:class I SAM-dependent methyltransferase n=1 Tax=Methanosarcina sp. Mfa9 TaxID=3439063 RepID=UPI003F860024
MKYADVDKIYRNVPLDKIPWNSETPPDALVKLVQSGKVRPCKAIDLGCGAGNYAIYLAEQGFEVIGVDSSPAAIKIAAENAEKKGVRCRFIVADLLGDLHEVKETFDFGYDWELLHHIFPEDREKYIKNVYNVLKPGALYFSVCFSEKDPQFGDAAKFRKTKLGTTLYFSSESEIRDLLSPYFVIQELKKIEINAMVGSHYAVSVLAKRR